MLAFAGCSLLCMLKTAMTRRSCAVRKDRGVGQEKRQLEKAVYNLSRYESKYLTLKNVRKQAKGPLREEGLEEIAQTPVPFILAAHTF